MFARICFLLCATILLVRANPICRATTDSVLHSNDESQENTGILAPENKRLVEDSVTEDSNSNDDDGAESQTEDDKSETEEISGTQETPVNSDNGDGSGTESGGNDESEASSDADVAFDDEKFVPLESDVSDDESETKGENENKSDSSNNEKTKTNSQDNENKVDNESNNESDHELNPDSDSEDHDFDGSDENRENRQILSTLIINGLELRMYKYPEGDEEIICQKLMRNSDNRCLEKQCFISPRFFQNSNEYGVSVSHKYAFGKEFICQEIISVLTGPMQQLCATGNEYFFHESPLLLDEGSRRFAQPYFGLGGNEYFIHESPLLLDEGSRRFAQPYFGLG